MKKHFFYLLSALLIAMMSFGFVSCGDDEEGGDSIPYGLIGSWVGTNGNWDFYYSFSSDGTGSGRGYSRRGSEYIWEFVFTVKGEEVKCKGASAYIGADGETKSDNNWSTTFHYNGSTMTGGQFMDVTYRKQ